MRNFRRLRRISFFLNRRFFLGLVSKKMPCTSAVFSHRQNPWLFNNLGHQPCPMNNGQHIDLIDDG